MREEVEKIKQLPNSKIDLLFVLIAELITVVFFIVISFSSFLNKFSFLELLGIVTLSECLLIMFILIFMSDNNEIINIIAQKKKIIEWRILAITGGISSIVLILIILSIKPIYLRGLIKTLLPIVISLLITWYGYFKKIDIYLIKIFSVDHNHIHLRIQIKGQNEGYIKYKGFCTLENLYYIENKIIGYEEKLVGKNQCNNSEYVKITPHSYSEIQTIDIQSLEPCIKVLLKYIVYETDEGIIIYEPINLNSNQQIKI